MANPIWPAGLPQSVFVGASDVRASGVAEFPTDTGPPKKRRTHGNVQRNVSAPLIVSGATREVFENFYAVTLMEGSLDFDWVDPLYDTTTTFRFRNPPTWTFGSSKADGGRWETTLALEILA